MWPKSAAFLKCASAFSGFFSTLRPWSKFFPDSYSESGFGLMESMLAPADADASATSADRPSGAVRSIRTKVSIFIKEQKYRLIRDCRIFKFKFVTASFHPLMIINEEAQFDRGDLAFAKFGERYIKFLNSSPRYKIVTKHKWSLSDSRAR